MNIHEAIATRRTIPLVTEQAVAKEVIEKVIESAIYAPSHYVTEPWRFFVLQGDGRNQLGEVLAKITTAKQENPSDEDSVRKIEKARNNPLRSPVVIAVAVEPSDDKRVIEKEEFAAVSAAIQNMLLTAHALGLGAVWRTGAICYDRGVSDFFNLSEKGEVVGFIYLGYPAKEPKPITRTDASQLTTWIS